jgi:hypothetical protein
VLSAWWRIEMRHAPTGPCDAPTNVPRVDEIGGTSVPTTRKSTFALAYAELATTTPEATATAKTASRFTRPKVRAGC